MLKKLKSIFIIEEEGAQKPPVKESKSTSASSSSQKTTKSSSTASPAPSDGTPEEKFVNILLEAVEKNNVEGFDYLEYKQSLQSLSKMNMDEATQYKSAFAMASTMGVDKAKLVSSVKRYLSVLKNEEVKFNKALANQIDQKVGQRKNDLKKLTDTIAQKEKQIQQLQKEIEQHKKDLGTLEAEMKKAAGKVDGTKANFYASYKVVTDQMEADLKKINQYL